VSNIIRAELMYLAVMRVQNGWTISDPNYELRNGYPRAMLVASSPRELAGIIQCWAEQQEKAADRSET
jgi:hypothetical protein